jgi:uncharacterized membrane protein YdjX (TVP38/TMEM64 family)
MAVTLVLASICCACSINTSAANLAGTFTYVRFRRWAFALALTSLLRARNVGTFSAGLTNAFASMFASA